MSRGTFGVFFRPMCLIFWALLVLMVVYPRVRDFIKKKKGIATKAEGEPDALM